MQIKVKNNIKVLSKVIHNSYKIEMSSISKIYNSN
jgi:hypothetical protein